MLNRKEKLTLLGKFITIIMCLFLGIMVLLNVNSITKKEEQSVFPIITNATYDIKQQNVENINLEFRKMMIKHPDINSIILYKFVPDKGTSIYTGQLNITSESKDGKQIPTDDTIVPMIDGTNNIQEILLNNVHYENISTIQLLCENKFDTTQLYSCEKYKNIGSKFKSVIFIPIVRNIDVGVVGYIMVTLSSEYDNIQVQDLVNGLRPYITIIQPLIS